MTLLILGRAGEGTGPAKKMMGMAASLSRGGHDVRCVVVSETGLPGVIEMGRHLASFQGEAVLVRTDYALVALWPILAALRCRGTRVVIEVPTPMRTARRAASVTTVPWRTRVGMLAGPFLQAPWAWWSSHQLLMYGEEHWVFLLGNQHKVQQVNNGIDVHGVPRRNDRKLGARRETNFLAVGCYWPVHGLDRFLRGWGKALSGTNQDGLTRWRLVVTGRGPARESLEALARENGLSQFVDFRGDVQDDELDRLFDWADIGVGVLAPHRLGMGMLSPLKHREYAARGLPFIAAVGDQALERAGSWVRWIASQDEGLDFEGLAPWIKECVLNRGVAVEELRSWSLGAIDYSETLEPLAIGTCRRRPKARGG